MFDNFLRVITFLCPAVKELRIKDYFQYLQNCNIFANFEEINKLRKQFQYVFPQLSGGQSNTIFDVYFACKTYNISLMPYSHQVHYINNKIAKPVVKESK